MQSEGATAELVACHETDSLQGILLPTFLSTEMSPNDAIPLLAFPDINS